MDRGEEGGSNALLEDRDMWVGGWVGGRSLYLLVWCCREQQAPGEIGLKTPVGRYAHLLPLPRRASLFMGR